MRLTVLAVLSVMSTIATAQDPIPGPEDSLPHQKIEALGGQLTKLGSANLIPFQLVGQLDIPLAQSIEALQSADPTKAIQHLEVFKNKVKAQVLPEIGVFLATQASDIQDQISELADRLLFAEFGVCILPDAADFRIIMVGPSESQTTISAALEFAAAQGYGAVQIMLAPDIYREDLISIDRHTRIISAADMASVVGRIVNTGPYLMELENIVIANSDGTGIFADNACAVTILTNVEVQRTNGTGIWQRGGSFTANGLTVAFSGTPTFPSAGDRNTGRGLHVSNGARACLTDVDFIQNDAGALLVEDFLTRVFVSRMSALLDDISPVVQDEIFELEIFVPGSGTIEVREQAVLFGEWINLTSGQVAGFLLDDNAQAHLRYSQIDATREIRKAGIGASSLGGFNIVARSGVLQLNSVLVRRSFVGITIPDASRGLVGASGLRITDSTIAAAIRAATSFEMSCAVSCLTPELERNRRRLDFNVAPLPDPVGCPACPSVDFSPTWCDE